MIKRAISSVTGSVRPIAMTLVATLLCLGAGEAQSRPAFSAIASIGQTYFCVGGRPATQTIVWLGQVDPKGAQAVYHVQVMGGHPSGMYIRHIAVVEKSLRNCIVAPKVPSLSKLEVDRKRFDASYAAWKKTRTPVTAVDISAAYNLIIQGASQ